MRAQKYRLRTFLPRVEVLESRRQPGTLLTKGLDLSILGSALDQNPLGATASTRESDAHSSLTRNLGPATSQALASGGSAAGAPYQATHRSTENTSSLTLGTTRSSGLGFLDQGLATAAHVGGAQAAAAVRPPETGALPILGQSYQAGLNAQAFPPVVPLSPSAMMPVAAHPIDVKFSTLAGQSQDHHPPISSVWASYFGNRGDNGLYHVVVAPDGQTIYAVGWTTVPGSRSRDLVVIQTTDGSTSPPAVATLASTTGGIAKGFGIDLDSNGNVLVSGYVTDAGGNPSGVVASFTPDLSAVNWEFGFDQPSAVQSVRDVGGTVYFTGSAGGDLLIGEADESGHVNVANTLQSNYASVGNAVDIDPSGNLDIAVTLTDAAGNHPATVQVTADGSTLLGGLVFEGGDTNAGMNGVVVDAFGDALYVGTILNGDHDSLLLAAVAPDGMNMLFAYEYMLSGANGPLNLYGYDEALDASGNLAMVGTYDDGSGVPGSVGHILFYGSDSGDGGVRGSGDDYGYGVALSSSGHIVEVGRTNSTDLPVNGFQTTYSGGPFDGWIGSFTSP
jgi:hypothetical protein